MQSFIDHPSQSFLATPLTTDQLDRLKAELEAFVNEQRERLARSEGLFRVLAADSSVDGIEREPARRAAEEAYALIQETNRALGRLSDGTYGSCVRCSRLIPFERLEAVPRTTTCVACPGD